MFNAITYLTYIFEYIKEFLKSFGKQIWDHQSKKGKKSLNAEKNFASCVYE